MKKALMAPDMWLLCGGNALRIDDVRRLRITDALYALLRIIKNS